MTTTHEYTEMETTVLNSDHVCVNIEEDELVDRQPLLWEPGGVSKTTPLQENTAQHHYQRHLSHPLTGLFVHSTCKSVLIRERVDENLLPVNLASSEDSVQDEAQFLVGKDRQLMVGRRSQMAALSAVFNAMFRGPLQEAGDVVEIPDVEPQAFSALLRFADNERTDSALGIDDVSVWETLKAADKYDVKPLTDLCFKFLIHKHPRRKRSYHLCCVLEMAHRLNSTCHHRQVLHEVKRRAARVLKNQAALAELCQQCMLALVQADDLVGVGDEILVHDAVLKWTRGACMAQGKQSPSWEELRKAAGDLVQHVRYLTLPRHTLSGFRAVDPSSCLLTEKELDSLLHGHAAGFFDTVRLKRVAKLPRTKKEDRRVCGERVNGNCILQMVFLVILVVLILFPMIYIPISQAAKGDDGLKESRVAISRAHLKFR